MRRGVFGSVFVLPMARMTASTACNIRRSAVSFSRSRDVGFESTGEEVRREEVRGEEMRREERSGEERRRRGEGEEKERTRARTRTRTRTRRGRGEDEERTRRGRGENGAHGNDQERQGAARSGMERNQG